MLLYFWLWLRRPLFLPLLLRLLLQLLLLCP
jgi:hypothetical protein